jgi:copper(I)-binding protein
MVVMIKYFLMTFLIMCGPVSAESYRLDNLMVENAFAYPTNGKSGAGYLSLINEGPEDVLIGVTGNFPRVMVHESVIKDGLTTMQHRMAVKVPARGQLEFEPGSHHVMFMGLAEHWRVGDEIEVTLKFKIAGHLDIKFLVIPRP